jgi:hypothetical protein
MELPGLHALQRALGPPRFMTMPALELVEVAHERKIEQDVSKLARLRM